MPNYSEVDFKMDKWMPDESEIQDEYYDIKDSTTLSKEEKIEQLSEFFEMHACEETFFHYIDEEDREEASIRGFCEYVVNQE